MKKTIIAALALVLLASTTYAATVTCRTHCYTDAMGNQHCRTTCF